MKRLIGVLFLIAMLLCGCGEKEENYNKVGSYEEEDNTVIPGDGFADWEDIGDGEAGISSPEASTPTEAPERQYVIAIDAGHGGTQSGASYDGRIEKNENLRLAKLLRDYLESNYDNISVWMTREDDTTMADSVAEDLRLRVESAKKAGADIYISVHFNASESHNSHGAMVCISKQENVHAASEALAEGILAALETLGLKNNGPYMRNSTDTYDENGVAVDYYAVNRHGANYGIPAIIMESCYMDSVIDIPFMSGDEALKRMAEAEAKAIATFLFTYYSE